MAESAEHGIIKPTERLILIAIDGSEHSEKAFDFYVDHLHQHGNRLFLIHAAEPPMMTNSPSDTQFSSAEAMMLSQSVWDQMLDSEKQKVRELENKYADKMKASNIPGKIKAVFSGRPGETIVETAQEEKATMIVLGTRGLGTIRRTIMGSVSDYVVHHANVPVIVCRHT